MTTTKDDEIDLLEIFEILWGGKWTISLVTLGAILFGGGVLFLKEPNYEAKLMYSVDTIPPFIEQEKATIEFQNMFYSANIFEDWKNSAGIKSLLIFDDLSTTVSVNGFVFAKNEDEMFAMVKPNKTGSSAIIVKTNQLNLLNDVYTYAAYINNVLKNEFVIRSKDELAIIETRFKDLKSVDNSIVQIVLSIDRYIASANSGANVIDIKRPTMPQKISPKSPLILALSVVLGGMVGVLCVLVRNAIRKRKAQLAES